MKQAVLFNQSRALDFFELRINTIRIPEVLSTLKASQDIWDTYVKSNEDFNIINFVSSSDEEFNGNLRLKRLMTALVQVGLYRRLSKKNFDFNFFIGDTQCDSALNCALGRISLRDLILESPCVSNIGFNFSTKFKVGTLSGHELEKFSVVESNSSGLQVLEIKNQSIANLVTHLINDHKVGRIVNLGPGTVLPLIKRDFQHEEVQFAEAIDLDPMLSWFWGSIKPEYFSVAQ